MAKKARPERVEPAIGVKALESAEGNIQSGWTEYIVVHFRATGSLSPGCDMRDWSEWARRYKEQHGG